jgi:Predicted acyltransferases
MTGSKPHYIVLDALRGVAALMVLLYHLFEAVAFAAGAPEQKMFHGFLAVDFFLILSGFVMGYAYDEKWDVMSVGRFFKKRLIRLHPMVVIGVLIGFVVFCCQGCRLWDGSQAGFWRVFASALLALFLLPSPRRLDVRGNTEMFPLNGPHWSLFFEYIGSILYALLLRRLSTRWLKVWVAAAAVALLAMGLFGPDGCIAYGWSSQPVNMLGGFIRMSFAYPAGLLLARFFRERKPSVIKGPVFLCCAVALILLLCVPSLGSLKVYYELICVAVAFPAIIWTGARAGLDDGSGKRAIKMLGDLSYPLYAVHYPFIYLYIGWINAGRQPFGPQPWATPVAIALISIATAAICFYLYDRPLRGWLNRPKRELPLPDIEA